MADERELSGAAPTTGGAEVATEDDLEWFEGWEDAAAVLVFLRTTNKLTPR